MRDGTPLTQITQFRDKWKEWHDDDEGIPLDGYLSIQYTNSYNLG
jgi:hypothetical protein